MHTYIKKGKLILVDSFIDGIKIDWTNFFCPSSTVKFGASGQPETPCSRWASELNIPGDSTWAGDFPQWKLS